MHLIAWPSDHLGLPGIIYTLRISRGDRYTSELHACHFLSVVLHLPALLKQCFQLLVSNELTVLCL